MTDQATVLLSPAIRERIDHWNLRYPPEQKRSGVFEALRLVQEENGGYLTTPLMDAVADYLSMPRVAVYEIATFYTMFYTKPVGKHILSVCTNISCSLSKADELVAHIKERLKIGLNETTADGKITVEEVECLGACVSPPVCQVGKKYHVNMTKEKLDQLLDEMLS